MVKFKTRQRGSVKVFVIVGLVLTVLAFGTLYGAKRVAMNDQTPPMNVPETTETPTETGSQVAQNNTAETTADKSGATEEQTNTQSTTETTTQSAADDLPQTGPADNAVLATVLTATAVVAFVKSRRLL